MGMVGLRDVFVVAPAYHHHHHHHHQDAGAITGSNAAAAADQQINGTAATALGVGVGVGVIPLLTAAPCLAAAPPPPPQQQPQTVEDTTDINFLSNSRSNKVSGIHLWQNQTSQTQYLHFKNQPTNVSPMNLMQTGFGGLGPSTTGGGVGSSSNSGSGSASGGTTCQDCGNQAKKECSHKRCRTCCKSRAFDCPTHVKSTWVPAARRRERQLMAAAGAGSSVSTSGTKKPRLVGSQQQQQQQTTSHTSTSNTTPPRSFDTSSSHQADGGIREGWPGQIRAPAVFKCVRVTALEDGEDEYAYQAVVKIGGHVFKGFLYDQGVDPKDGIPNISELHLGGSGGGGGGGRNGNGNGNSNNGASSSSPIVEPSDVYGGGGFLGGSGYG